MLATDLDGTFAAGGEAVRAALVDALHGAADARLIYVTGRSPESTGRLREKIGLPAPDLLIADVGTSVVSEAGERIAELEAAIARCWPGGDTVRDRLADLPGLAEQDVRSPHRVSYAAHEPDELESIVREVGRRLEGLTIDLLPSGDRYIDVLPYGINKGSTLRRVLAWLDVPEDRTVVAGDSLNDLSLFETGIAGILVGNADPRMSRQLAGRRHVHLSEHEGVGAIVDGLTRFGFLDVIDPS